MKAVSIIPLVLALLPPSYGAEEPLSFPEAMMTIPERTNYDRTSTFAEVVAVVDALGQRESKRARGS